MPITTIPGRKFNQDVAGAKRAADEGPVIITDRGEPAYVLIRHDAWRKLVGKRGPSMAELLGQRDGADIEFDPPRMMQGFPRAADLD